MYDKYFPDILLFMLSDILSMLKRLKAAIVYSHNSILFPLHARRTNWKDYVMIFLSIFFKPVWLIPIVIIHCAHFNQIYLYNLLSLLHLYHVILDKPG